MSRLHRSADRANSALRFDLPSNMQNRSAAERMSDEKRRCRILFLQIFRGGFQIAEIARKIGLRKIALAFTQTGKIEPQNPKTDLRQPPRKIDRRPQFLSASKTMSKNRVFRSFPDCRKIQMGAQLQPIRILKSDFFHNNFQVTFLKQKISQKQKFRPLPWPTANPSPQPAGRSNIRSSLR